MAISLTKEEALARFYEPERENILSLALNEDIKNIFPLHLTRSDRENSLIIAGAIHDVVLKVLLRALNIIYDENLDS